MQVLRFFTNELRDILENKILVPRRSKEERSKNYNIALQKQIQQYIKDGGKGDLDLYNTPITSLPDNLKVERNLYLRDTPITSLPDNLQVGGYLILNNTPISSLPDNLKVGRNLILSNTPLTSLPDNLKVGGDLELFNTQITSLPNNLKVGGDLELRNTPLSKKYSKEEIRQMIEDKGGEVKGKIYI